MQQRLSDFDSMLAAGLNCFNYLLPFCLGEIDVWSSLRLHLQLFNLLFETGAIRNSTLPQTFILPAFPFGRNRRSKTLIIDIETLKLH